MTAFIRDPGIQKLDQNSQPINSACKAIIDAESFKKSSQIHSQSQIEGNSETLNPLPSNTDQLQYELELPKALKGLVEWIAQPRKSNYQAKSTN